MNAKWDELDLRVRALLRRMRWITARLGAALLASMAVVCYGVDQLKIAPFLVGVVLLGFALHLAFELKDSYRRMRVLQRTVAAHRRSVP